MAHNFRQNLNQTPTSSSELYYEISASPTFVDDPNQYALWLLFLVLVQSITAKCLDACQTEHQAACYQDDFVIVPLNRKLRTLKLNFVDETSSPMGISLGEIIYLRQLITIESYVESYELVHGENQEDTIHR